MTEVHIDWLKLRDLFVAEIDEKTGLSKTYRGVANDMIVAVRSGRPFNFDKLPSEFLGGGSIALVDGLIAGARIAISSARAG